MASELYKTSVPGSLMLFGEHAVLHGKQAVVCAVNQHIYVELIPRKDRNIKIISHGFDQLDISLDDFAVVKPFEYVLTAIKQYLNKIKTGFDLNIRSDFPSNIGFGSSAAVTVSVIAVLSSWLEKESPDLMNLFKQAVTVVREVQGGVGSGADVAASVSGGVIAYKMEPVRIDKIADELPLVAVYSGSKIPTTEVIAAVEKNAAQFPGGFSKLYNDIDLCVKKAVTAIENNDLVKLGELMNAHHELQKELGTSNKVLEELVFGLRKEDKIFGAKISGAGLGDCVIGLGEIAKNKFPDNDAQKKSGVRQIGVAVSATGLEKNQGSGC